MTNVEPNVPWYQRDIFGRPPKAKKLRPQKVAPEPLAPRTVLEHWCGRMQAAALFIMIGAVIAGLATMMEPELEGLGLGIIVSGLLTATLYWFLVAWARAWLEHTAETK